jgi:hypothetical protein
MAKKDYTSASSNYMTPIDLYQPILDFMGIDKFDTDIACSNMNIPAKKYRTPDGEFLENDFFFKVSDKTGLDGDFGAGVHFMNPPFDLARHFLKVINEELKKEPSSRFWCILPSDRFETKYYREYIVNNPNCFIMFLPKAGFLIPGTPLDKPKPSVKVMYCYFGTDAETTARSFQEVYGQMGAVVYNKLNNG